MQNCDNRRILKCPRSLWAQYSWVRFNSASRSYLNKWVSFLSLLSSDLSPHTLSIFSSLFWPDLPAFLASKLLTMARRKALRPAHRIAFTAFLSSTAKNNVSSHDYYNRRYKEMNKKRWSIDLYENFTESHMNRMKDLWREYVECFFLSLRFIDSSTDRRIFLDTARWWTSISIIRLRRLLRAESTISFTECATSIRFEKLASSSSTDISSAKCTSNTRINELVRWCWRRSTRYAVTNARVLSSANENESVHRWISGTKAWLEQQRDEQILVERERLLEDAALSLSDEHQLLPARTSANADHHSALADRDHRFSLWDAAEHHLRRYWFVHVTR